jgi:hypothetical protein
VFLSPEAEKRQQRASFSRKARDVFMDSGPHLEDGMVIIPSPQQHDGLKAKLYLHEFKYKANPDIEYPHYGRSTSRKLTITGRRYTPEQWLNWAWRAYAWAWGE